MQFNNYIKTKLPFFVALSFTFVLASCGSYQYVGYDSDGIYQERQVVYEEANDVETETPVSEAESSSYYKNYFNEKANQYSNIPDDERIIFTDIDSYEGEYADEVQEEDSGNGYAGWGQASNNITVNYIDYGWGFNDPWLWNGAWGWRYGWNRYGWNSWGWNTWGWNAGYGTFGWGWNNWGWNAGWGYNYWCPPGFNGYYYNNRNLAYNSGRRGSNLAYGNRNSVTRRNSSTVTRRGSTARRNNSSTIRRNNSSTIRRNNSSTIRRNTTRTRSSNTRSNSNITRPRSSSTRTNIRSTTPRRSNSTTTRSSRSSTRSSGTSSRSSSSRGSSGRRR